MNRFAMSALSLFLAGCIGGSEGGDTLTPTEGGEEPLPTEEPAEPGDGSGAGGDMASCTTGRHLGGGRHHRVALSSKVDGAPIVFEVFEPAYFDCDQRHPLILEGHGFGGSRQTAYVDSMLAPINTLADAGYTVISVDQRGHGESGGSVRVMDPDYEGQDLLQILDWAEAHLDYLAYRDDNLLLGTVGGSYGGGFQYLLYTLDPKQRLDAMVPQITWHNLDYSLNPGNVPKSYWGLVLSGAGDTGTAFDMDPLLRSTLLEAGLTNHMPEVARDFLSYHSLAYSCSNPRDLKVMDGDDTGEYSFDPALQLLPLTAEGKSAVGQPRGELYPVDVLMFQGFRDTLFNFNEAWRNYECLQEAGGDVRLLSYPFGHHYLQPSIGLVQEGVHDGETFLGSLSSIASGEAGAAGVCHGIDIKAATLAWFEEKLRGRGSVDDVITSGQRLCLSLGYGDDILVDKLPIGGLSKPVSRQHDQPVLARTGLLGALPTLVSLGTLTEEAVLAGIPVLDVSVKLPRSFDGHCAEEYDDKASFLAECDAILFVGLGVLRNGQEPELVDEQVMPLRGLGEHRIEMVAVAERLAPGDELFLMIYGAHPSFVTGMSRDPAVLLVEVKGKVKLPLLSSDGQQELAKESLMVRENTVMPATFAVEPSLTQQMSFSF